MKDPKPTENTARKTAEDIIADFKGAGYYNDADILSDFLVGRFGSTKEAASSAAQQILEDRRGANYYNDPAILSDYLNGKLSKSE